MTRLFTTLARHWAQRPTALLGLLALALLTFGAALALTACGGGKTLAEAVRGGALGEPLGGRAPWGMFGKDDLHQRRSEHKGPAKATTKWKFQSGGKFYGSAVIDGNGVAYFATSADEAFGGGQVHSLYAVNSNGSLKWSYPLNRSTHNSTPAIGIDGTIYQTDYNRLIALNPDGTEKWILTADAGLSRNTPTIGKDGTIYVGSGFSNVLPVSSTLFAVNPDGTIKWTYYSGGDPFNCEGPAIATGGTVYAVTFHAPEHSPFKCRLHAVNPDGTGKWIFDSERVGDSTTSCSPMVGADGSVYFIAQGGSGQSSALFSIASDGTQNWALNLNGYQSGSFAAAADGTMYVSQPKALWAVNSTGTIKWVFTASGKYKNFSPCDASAVDGNGCIYVGSFDGSLYAFNSNGTLKWSLPIYGSSPIKIVYSSPAIGADGTVFIGGAGNDGKLWAIGPGTP